MNITLRVHPNGSLLSVSGEIGSDSSGFFDATALVPDLDPLVLDLREVTRLHASAAATLVGELRMRHELGGTVVLLVGDHDVTVELVLAGADLWAAMAESMDDAMTIAGFAGHHAAV